MGYKIFYYSIPSNSRNPEEIEVVSASHTTHNLIFLDMYTNYSISILAFNPAGEGPRSNPINVKTLQGIPGPPANLQFSEITMNTLKVSWEPPAKPNGEILGYIVAYETAEQDESKCYCVTHKSPLICIFCTSFKTSTMNKSRARAPLSVIHTCSLEPKWDDRGKDCHFGTLFKDFHNSLSFLSTTNKYLIVVQVLSDFFSKNIVSQLFIHIKTCRFIRYSI